MAPTRVAFVVEHLSHIGGAEKSMAKLVNYLAGTGRFVVGVVCLSNLPHNATAYPLDEDVKLLHLERRNHLATVARVLENRLPGFLRWRLDKWSKRYGERLLAWYLKSTGTQLVVSFMPIPIMVSAGAVRLWPIPHIASHRTNPRRHRFYHEYMGALARACAEADCNVVLHNAYRDYFAGSKRIAVIPNGIDLPAGLVRPTQAERSPVIISVGRMVESKNHQLLFKAFAQVAAQFPEWQLHVYGEPILRESLDHLRSVLGLPDRIKLFDPTEAIIDKLLDARVYASGSRFEGWGRAVGEAMLCELPVIALQDCTPINSFVSESQGGLLVKDDPADLAQVLRHLIADPELAARMGRRGRLYMEPFNETSSHLMWQDLINDTVGNSAARRAEP